MPSSETHSGVITEQFTALADLGPLGIGRTITVNTEIPPDLDNISRQIRAK